MRQEIARLECSMPSGDRIQVNVSIGVSEYLVGDAGPQQMMQRADQALYRAKNPGRNRVEIA
jgi:diguanylate cyclase (GGDEF)-like protein